MPGRFGASFRVWQTGLFMVVIVIAILILSGSLSAGLKLTLTEMGKSAELRDTTALALRLESDFPLTGEGLASIQQTIGEYRRIYNSGVWVYDERGTLLQSSFDSAPADADLEAARREALLNPEGHASMDLSPGGLVIASKTILGSGGEKTGIVVTASPVTASLGVLEAVRNRLWVTFWISLTIASLVGFTFSELIGRRARAMSDAAAAMADGDFDRRIQIGFAPDEIYDMTVSYNRMADHLGQAFAAVQEREQEISAVVASMAEGVVAFDAAGSIRIVNPEAARLLGSSAEELVGRTAEEVLRGERVLAVVASGLGGTNAEATVSLGDSAVLLHCTPLFDEGGEVEGAVLVLADITERFRIEEAQRRFVADASHELRTPTAALSGILELLEDGAKDDEAVRDDFIHTMRIEVDRLGRLIADLLTLARLESGSLRLKLAPVPVEALASDVTGVMRALADQVGVTLAVELPEGDVEVLADRDRIEQVLLGFLDNALKHSPQGSTIHLSTTPEGSSVLLQVRDEGPGIEPDKLRHVFDRFYRADVSRGGGQGTGLGLAIAKEIVEAHDSTIEVDSSPGNGATFSFRLPLA